MTLRHWWGGARRTFLRTKILSANSTGDARYIARAIRGFHAVRKIRAHISLLVLSTGEMLNI
jgi:hypothetical protein